MISFKWFSKESSKNKKTFKKVNNGEQKIIISGSEYSKRISSTNHNHDDGDQDVYKDDHWQRQRQRQRQPSSHHRRTGTGITSKTTRPPSKSKSDTKNDFHRYSNHYSTATTTTINKKNATNNNNNNKNNVTNDDNNHYFHNNLNNYHNRDDDAYTSSSAKTRITHENQIDSNTTALSTSGFFFSRTKKCNNAQTQPTTEVNAEHLKQTFTFLNDRDIQQFKNTFDKLLLQQQQQQHQSSNSHFLWKRPGDKRFPTTTSGSQHSSSTNNNKSDTINTITCDTICRYLCSSSSSDESNNTATTKIFVESIMKIAYAITNTSTKTKKGSNHDNEDDADEKEYDDDDRQTSSNHTQNFRSSAHYRRRSKYFQRRAGTGASSNGHRSQQEEHQQQEQRSSKQNGINCDGFIRAFCMFGMIKSNIDMCQFVYFLLQPQPTKTNFVTLIKQFHNQNPIPRSTLLFHSSSQTNTTMIPPSIGLRRRDSILLPNRMSMSMSSINNNNKNNFSSSLLSRTSVTQQHVMGNRNSSGKHLWIALNRLTNEDYSSSNAFIELNDIVALANQFPQLLFPLYKFQSQYIHSHLISGGERWWNMKQQYVLTQRDLLLDKQNATRDKLFAGRNTVIKEEMGSTFMYLLNYQQRKHYEEHIYPLPNVTVDESTSTIRINTAGGTRIHSSNNHTKTSTKQRTNGSSNNDDNNEDEDYDTNINNNVAAKTKRSDNRHSLVNQKDHDHHHEEQIMINNYYKTQRRRRTTMLLKNNHQYSRTDKFQQDSDDEQTNTNQKRRTHSTVIWKGAEESTSLTSSTGTCNSRTITSRRTLW